MAEQTQFPSTWLRLSIGDVAEVVAGGTPKAGNPDNFSVPGTAIAWLTPADLSKYSKKYISYGARDLSQQGYDTSSAKLMPPGTLLFSSRAPIGYVAIAENEISTNQGFKNFVLPRGLDSSYGYYYLKSIRSIAESMGTGTTFTEISGANAKKLPFVLASSAEQKVIANKLDTLLAQVENTKARLEHIPKILKRFRQSVLTAAVSGRLTENWRATNHPAQIDVKEVSDQLFNEGFTGGNFGRQSDRAPQITNSELDRVINHTEAWPAIRVGELCACIVPNRDKPKSFSGGYHWLLTQHFEESNVHINYCNIELGLSSQEVIDFKAKIIPEEHVVMTCVGRLGLSAIVTEPCVINQQLHAFNVSCYILPKYLAYCIRANKAFYEARSTSTTISYLNKTACNSLPIPLPIIAEQTEIVRRVDQLFAHADTIEKQVNNALARVNNLTQSILAKAFRGELTEQWRKDNPELISGDNSAEALLERIKTERATMKPSKHTRGKNSA